MKNRKKCGLSLALLLCVIAVFGQKNVKGKITDKDGLPIIGATIIEKNTENAVLTDVDGQFSIDVTSNESILNCSYIGHNSQEIIVGSQSEYAIILEEATQILSEVVVTALGIKKEKAKLGYAVQEVDGRTLTKVAESNVAASLSGKVAGLTIYNKATLFETPVISLRGGSTLVVIDGVPSNTDFWNISSNDIESINVLKGTAAAALYGSQGINGAIMITTKKGKAEKGVEITFNSSNQFQAGFIKIPETQKEYGMGWNGQYAFVDGKGSGTFDDYGYVFGPKLNQVDPNTKSGFVEIPQWNSEVDPATGKLIPLPWISRGADNLKSFLRNQMITTNNVSIAGKTDASDYRLSLSHMYQKGQVPNTFINSTTATLASGVKISEKIKAQSTISYNRHGSPNYPSAGYGADNYFYNIILWMGADVDITNMQNYWQAGKTNLAQKTYNYTWYNNPYYLSNEYRKSYYNDVVTGNASLTFDLAKNLQFIMRTGVTNSSIFEDRKTPYTFIWYSNGAAPQGNYSIDRKGRFQILSDGLLTWTKKLTDKLETTVSAGGSHRFNTYNSQNSRTAGLNIPGFYSLSNSISPVTSTNYLEEREVKSAYGFMDLNYNRMVYLSVTGRNDWTSSLQAPYNSFFYPSATASIVLSEMISMPKWISLAKLRGAWADVSTDVAPYSTIPTYQSGIRWNGNLSLGLPSSLISPGLKPNQTISKEIGAQLNLFKSRIGLDITYFNYDDKNFIIQAPISVASGFENRLVNGGIVNRRGLEIVVSASPIKGADYGWDVIANYGDAKQYRKEYYGGEEILGGVKVGERNDVYRGWAWQRDAESGKIITIGGRPQYIDHEINLGYFDPDFSWGFINQFRYKDFAIAVNLDGRVGGKMVNGVEQKLYEGGMHPSTANQFREDSYNGISSYLVDGLQVVEGSATWDIQGNLTSDDRKYSPNTTKVKYIDHLFDTHVNGITESNMYDKDFAKLREASITYNIPAKLLKGGALKAVNLSLVGRNLAIWTKVPFMDPDSFSNYNDNYQIAEPTYRNIGFNLNCTF